MSWKGAGAWGGGGAGQQWGSSGGGQQWGGGGAGAQSWTGGGGGGASSWGGASGKGGAGAGAGGASAWGAAPQVVKAPASGKGAQTWAQQFTAAKGGQAGNAAKGAAKGTPQQDPAVVAAALKAKVAKTTADTTSAENATTAVLEASQKVLDNESATAGALKASMDSLEKQSKKLEELGTQITKDCEEARKSGPANMTLAQDLAKQLIKGKSVTMKLTLQLGKLKPRHFKAEKEAELKAKDAKDSAAFKAVLTKAKSEVNAVEVAVKGVERQAAPVLSKPPEGDALDTKTAAIEKSATEALAKFDTTKAALTEHFKAIQVYSPEAKKNAQTALMELQKKLAEHGSVCRVYKSFKKEMPRIIENQKAVAEVTEKLNGHDPAITKASKLAETGDKLTRETLATIDGSLEPITKAIKDTLTAISVKSRQADASTQAKLGEQKTKAENLKKKIDAVYAKIKEPKDKFNAQDAVEAAQEKTQKAEEAFKECQESEMPFLTGVEVLPEEEMTAAIKACNDAATKTSAAVNDGRTYVKQMLAEARKYVKDLFEATTADLTKASKTLQELDGKVSQFRKDLTERKNAALLSEPLEAAEIFEKKVKAAEKEGKPLSPKAMEDESSEAIQAAIDKTKAASNEASTLGTEAKKVLAAKTREARASSSSAFTSLQQRLGVSMEKLSALRFAVIQAEKLLKAKAALIDGEEKVKEAEAETAKAKKLVPKEGKKLKMDGVTALDEACTAALKSIKLAISSINPHMGVAPAKAKADLQLLLDRIKESQAVIDKVKADTKEKRAETLTDHFISEGEALTAAAEEAAANMEKAEGPFLVGNTLELKVMQDLLVKCKAASAETLKKFHEAQKFQSAKTQEARPFGEEMLKKIKESFAGTGERLTKVKAKLTTFDTETKDRAKASRMVEAAQLVDEAEGDVKKLVKAAEPFTKEGGDKLSEAEAEKPLKVYMDLAKETTKKLAAVKGALMERQKEQKDDAVQMVDVKALQERLAKANEELAPGKKAAAPHEQRSLGTRLLAELKEQIGTLGPEVKKATDVMAPLLEHGGADFLVGTSVKTLAAVLTKHMKEKELTEADVFKKIGEGKSLKEKVFTKYLEGLAEAIGHDETSAFTEERRAAVFKRLASNGKSISSEDFAGIFARSHACIKETTVTDNFAVEGSATVCKVEPDTEVLLIGQPKEDEAGLLRSECKVDGKAGWITIKQAKGQSYLKSTVAFTAFCSSVEKAIGHANSTVQQASSSLNQKMKQGGSAEDGPLKEARQEMGKLRDDIKQAQTSIDDLRSKFAKARSEYQTKERAEVNAHVEARNAKEAAAFLEEPTEKVASLEADAKAVEDAGASITSLSGDELQAFVTPATVQEKVDTLSASISEKVAAVRKTLSEQIKTVNETKPQTGGTALAKQQLKQLSSKLDGLAAKGPKVSSQVKMKVKAIVDPKMEPSAEALRKHAETKKLSVAKLYEKLKGSQDKMPEAALSKLLTTLEGLSLSPEVAKLICRKIEADGISEDKFMRFACLYFKVVRGIALADNQDISKAKAVRKAEEGEVFEVLEGPVEDEKNSLSRVRVKACKEPHTEGWVTVAGSKGTTFMEKTTKPALPKPAVSKPAVTTPASTEAKK